MQEAGIKCSICGEREVLHNLNDDGSQTLVELRRAARQFWSDKLLDPEGEGRERLCGLCAFKRYLTHADTDLNTRWGGSGAPFPSTSSVAALPFLMKLVKHRNLLKDKIQSYVTAFSKTGEPKTFHLSGLPALEKIVNTSPNKDLLERFFEIDAEYLFPEIWQTKIRDAKRKGASLDKLERAAKLAKDLIDKTSESIQSATHETGEPGQKAEIDFSPSRHFSLLFMDGDQIGKLLLGDPETIQAKWEDVLHHLAAEKVSHGFAATGWPDLLKKKRLIGPALHAFLSRALAHFAYEVVPWLVETKHESRLIYIGGDDLLAMAPPEKVLELAQDLQEHFSAPFLTGDRESGFQILNGEQVPGNGRVLPMLGKHASLSASIVIAHHKTPLRPLITHAKILLEETAKKRVGRKAVVISVFTRNGEKITFGAPWKNGAGNTVDDLKNVAEGFKKKVIPGRLPYRLRELSPALEATMATLTLRQSLLKKTLEKGRSVQEKPSEELLSAIERLLEAGYTYTQKVKLPHDQMVNPLLLARFLGLKLSHGEKE